MSSLSSPRRCLNHRRGYRHHCRHRYHCRYHRRHHHHHVFVIIVTVVVVVVVMVMVLVMIVVVVWVCPCDPRGPQTEQANSKRADPGAGGAWVKGRGCGDGNITRQPNTVENT